MSNLKLMSIEGLKQVSYGDKQTEKQNLLAGPQNIGHHILRAAGFR